MKWTNTWKLQFVNITRGSAHSWHGASKGLLADIRNGHGLCSLSDRNFIYIYNLGKCVAWGVNIAISGWISSVLSEYCHTFFWQFWYCIYTSYAHGIPDSLYAYDTSFSGNSFQQSRHFSSLTANSQLHIKATYRILLGFAFDTLLICVSKFYRIVENYFVTLKFSYFQHPTLQGSTNIRHSSHLQVIICNSFFFSYLFSSKYTSFSQAEISYRVQRL